MHANAVSPIASLSLIAIAGLAFVHTAVAQSCEARSSAQPLSVVELYTSEGCSSCPPADQWLSTLKGKDGVLALAFHVNYWDKLGWPDRFATSAITQRQRQQQRSSGAAYVYTPQVVVNGMDTPAWGHGAIKPLPASPVQISLVREGARVTATVTGGSASLQLAGYWAVLEDGHATRVRAGENAGSTLQHDHVVAHYQPVPVWGSSGTPQKLLFEMPAATSSQPRRVVFVVTDPAGAKPLHAAVLRC